MEEVTDLKGGDSDDLSDIQPNAHAIAVTLFSRHPQSQQGGPLPNAEGNTMLIQQTNIQNVRIPQFLGDALDQERVCWIGQGRRASQHQRGQFESRSSKLCRCCVEMVHHVHALESRSEAIVINRQRDGEEQ